MRKYSRRHIEKKERDSDRVDKEKDEGEWDNGPDAHDVKAVCEAAISIAYIIAFLRG